MARKRKSKLQKRKENPRSRYWLLKADAAFREVVRRDYRGCCVVCYRAGTEVHHLISRSVRSLRHVRMNGILLCAKHHKFSNELSAHGAPMAFAAWLQRNRASIWEWISLQWEPYTPGYKPDYRAAYEKLCKSETSNPPAEGDAHGH